MRRAGLLLSFLWLSAGSSAAAWAADLPAAADLRSDGEHAGRERVPILMFFASHGCPYCYEVEEHYLKPRIASGEYRTKAIVRIVYTDSARSLKDFHGRKTDHAGLARRYGVMFTPTIKLVDADGVELAPALVGLTTRDFYGFYLDQAIDGALTKLRGPKLTLLQ